MVVLRDFLLNDTFKKHLIAQETMKMLPLKKREVFYRHL
jgi:hypothetical protein